MTENFYLLSAKSINGKTVSMENYKGKYVLVVNTASKCGLTPQYKGLEELYRRYKDNGFVILGFPCNQFANQEPGDEKSIMDGCLINYGVSFPMFAKVDVNGTNAHPIFNFLKRKLPGFGGSAIKWNFTKFLLDDKGTPIQRYSPYSKPEKINKKLNQIFNNKLDL